MTADLTLGDAAHALGVSLDTLRRWDAAGKLRTTRDSRNRRRVPPAGKLRPPRDPRTRRRVPAAGVERRRDTPQRHQTGAPLSARNRFPGVVSSVEADGVMALVEIEAGPFRVTAAVTRDSVEE